MAKYKGTIETNTVWSSTVGDTDDFGDKIKNVIIDGQTLQGPWALMTPFSWANNGVGILGTGYGQMYVRTIEGQWLKVEG